jgi:hypothetical protein
MKTKFILHGGFPVGEIPINDDFYGEILKESPKSSRILLVYFAKQPERIEKNKNEDMEQFKKNSGEKLLEFLTAREEIFEEQLKSSDIVYFHGGHSDLILDKIKKYSNLDKLFKGKTIAGDSAGANGLGILPMTKILKQYFLESINIKLFGFRRINLPKIFIGGAKEFCLLSAKRFFEMRKPQPIFVGMAFVINTFKVPKFAFSFFGLLHTFPNNQIGKILFSAFSRCPSIIIVGNIVVHQNQSPCLIIDGYTEAFIFKTVY